MLVYWFLPMILFLGIITSYEDIKFGKIMNKWVLLAILYGVIVNALLFSLKYYNSGYLIKFLINGLASLTIGFVVWYANLWTSGDAKLFFAYSLLMPLSVHKYGNVPYFSSINIFINTFSPLFVFFIFLLLFKTNLRQKIFYLKKSFEPKKNFQLLIFLFAFMGLINLFFSIFKITPNFFSATIFLFLSVMILERIFHTKLFITIFAIAILRLIFDKTAYSLANLKFLFFIWILFIILRLFFLNMGYDLLTKEVDVNLLKRGMIPAEKVYFKNGRYKKESILYFSLFSYLYEKTKGKKYVFESAAEGLSNKDIQKLKKLGKKLGFEHLRIHQTLPFAPFLFAGVLLTILFQGNLFVTLTFLWYHLN